MAKTLADMTAEERTECVGMWALIEGINLAVIAEVDETNTCVVVYPQWDGDSAVHLNGMVTPRYDLPRAWTPSGEPEPARPLAEETYEYSFQTEYADGWETACNDVTHVDEWWPDKSDAEDAANSAYDPYIERPIRMVRRRVTPPEAINE